VGITGSTLANGMLEGLIAMPGYDIDELGSVRAEVAAA
jgi:hypothetical protein